MKKIAIIGEGMIELSGTPFGSIQQSYGGDTLNTAIYLARLDLQHNLSIHYITALGKDIFSEAMLKIWQAEGINTQYVLRDKQRLSGLYFIQLDSSGERSFLHWRSNSAARYLLQHKAYQHVLAELSQMDLIYLSGISLAILPANDRALLISQLAQLKQKGIEIIFDSNYRPTLWKNPTEARKCYAQLFPLVDIALLTTEDEYLLWNEHNTEQVFHRLQQWGVQTVILKQGKEGAILLEKNCVQVIPTIPVENIVDTTSAGDAFNAGFITYYLQNKPLSFCCQQANKLASVVIQYHGAIIDKTIISSLFNRLEEQI